VQVEIPQTHELAKFADRHKAIAANIAQVIQGKREVIDLLIACLLAEGHVLIEDVPGVGKTQLAKSLARSIESTFQRIQFTPDLLPSDITGVSIWNRQTSEFEFKPGAIFANVVVGDEINRASPKTQAALLEAMEERQVTVDGTTRSLAPPFMVIATQNPLEHEGTYPLPEAQLDRFMMRLVIGYPDRSDSISILDRHGMTSRFDEIKPVVSGADINDMILVARRIHVADSVREYIVDLIEGTRRNAEIMLGASPRSALFIQRVSRARAAMDGRDYVTPDDVKLVAGPVLSHRMILRPEAHMRGTTMDSVIESVLSHLRVPGMSKPA